MNRNSVVAALAVCLGGASFWIGGVVSADDGNKPIGLYPRSKEPFPYHEPYVVMLEYVAPPICFLAKELDVNGDGIVTKADSEAAKTLDMDNPFFKKFYANLKTTWPEAKNQTGDDRLGIAEVRWLIQTLASSLAPRPGVQNQAKQVATVLVKWDGTVGGAVQTSGLYAGALKSLRARRSVFVYDFKAQSWRRRQSQPVRYLGRVPGSIET